MRTKADMADRIYTNAGKLYEIINEYGICTVLNDLATQEYCCVTKAHIEDNEIHWQTSCVFEKKHQAVKYAKEVETMYEIYKNRALIENVSQKLDDEISNYRDGDSFDNAFAKAYELTQEQYSTFDICATIALTVDRASEWDRRYSVSNVNWAKDFLFDNDIDANDYKSARLCNTHPAALNGFVDYLRDRTSGMSTLDMRKDNEELDLTAQQNISR